MKRKLITLILGLALVAPVVLHAPVAYADKGGRGKGGDPPPRPKPGPRDDGDGD